jgi:hypothetical protein
VDYGIGFGKSLSLHVDNGAAQSQNTLRIGTITRLVCLLSLLPSSLGVLLGCLRLRNFLGVRVFSDWLLLRRNTLAFSNSLIFSIAFVLSLKADVSAAVLIFSPPHLQLRRHAVVRAAHVRHHFEPGLPLSDQHGLRGFRTSPPNHDARYLPSVLFRTDACIAHAYAAIASCSLLPLCRMP